MFGTTQSEIKVWDVQSQSCVSEFRAKSTHPIVTDVCHCTSNNIAAVSSVSNNVVQNGTPSSSVQLWSIDHRGANHELISEKDDGGEVTKIVMDNTGTFLVSGSTDGIVRVYDMETHKKVRQFNAHMEGGVGGVLYHDNGKVLVTCGRTDGNILDWDLRDFSNGPKVVRRYTGATMATNVEHCRNLDMSYDPSSTYLMTASNTGAGVLYKTMKKSPIQRLESHLAPVVTVDWMPWRTSNQSLSFALTGSLDGTMRIWTLQPNVL